MPTDIELGAAGAGHELLPREATEARRWPGVVALTLVSNWCVRSAERRAWDLASTQRLDGLALQNHDAVVDAFSGRGQSEWTGPDVVTLLSVVLVAASVVRGFWMPRPLACVRTFLVHFSLTLFPRAICLLLTVYPDVQEACYLHTDKKPSWWVVLLPVLVPTATCGDMMPSGHTLFYCAACLAVSAQVKPLERVLVWAVGASGMLFLCLQHVHWSADVFVALCLSCLLWGTWTRLDTKSPLGAALRFLTG